MPFSKLIDITGQRFGRLVAIKRAQNRYGRKAFWKCRCDCGNIAVVVGKRLRNGCTNSCGCLSAELTGERFKKDITNQRFGRLVALKSVPEIHKWGQIVWRCKCDCEKIILVSSSSLRKKNTRSCGCLKDASRFAKGTNINPMDVPFEITNLMKTRRKLKKLIRRA